MKDPNKFKDVVLTDGNLRVVIEWIGEGWEGDYNPEDPVDEPLVRFYCDHKKGKRWEEIDSASYCTCMRATHPRKVYTWMARQIMDVLDRTLREGGSVKQAMSLMSWLGYDDYEKSQRKKNK